MRTPRHVTAPDGVLLAVHELGGDGPMLLLGHATGYCSAVWGPVAGHLAGEFRCVGIDGRAHGQSGRPAPESFTRSLLATDVIAVLEALNQTAPAFGAGHSAGGTGLMLAEAERPGSFEGLWCFEPVFFPPRASSEDEDDEGAFNPLATAARGRRWQFADRDEARAHYAGRSPFRRFTPEALDAFVECGLVEDEAGAGLRLACRPEDEGRFYETDDLEQGWYDLDKVGCPVTLATGDQPGAFGPAHAELLAGRLEFGQVEVLPGLSHFGPFEDPEAVARSIREALGAVDA